MLGLAALLALRGLANAQPSVGVLLFLAGIAVVHHALWKLRRGEAEGPHGAAHLWAAVRLRLSKSG